MRAKHGNWNSGEITSAEMLLVFSFPCVDQGNRARQYYLLFSCLLGNCYFCRLKALGTAVRFFYSMLAAVSHWMVSPITMAVWVSVGGEAQYITGCIHKYRATSPSRHTCLSYIMSGELTRSGAHHVLKAAAAGYHLPRSWCPCPPSLLPGEGTLNTQKLHVEHLLIMRLAVKSQDIKTSIFFVPYGSGTTRG